jgi:hypothetical protein
MELPDGSRREWPGFYKVATDAVSRTTGGERILSLTWPSRMLGRLATFADEVLLTPDYQAWVEHHAETDPVPAPDWGWNCHEFVRRMVPKYNLSLQLNEWNLPMLTEPMLGEPTNLSDLEGASPYYMGPIDDLDDGHSVVTTLDPAYAVNVFGGRMPLSWMAVDDIAKRYGSQAYPYKIPQ